MFGIVEGRRRHSFNNGGAVAPGVNPAQQSLRKRRRLSCMGVSACGRDLITLGTTHAGVNRIGAWLCKSILLIHGESDYLARRDR